MATGARLCRKNILIVAKNQEEFAIIQVLKLLVKFECVSKIVYSSNKNYITLNGNKIEDNQFYIPYTVQQKLWTHLSKLVLSTPIFPRCMVESITLWPKK